MFGVRYRGLLIVVTDAAMRELVQQEKSLDDVLVILEQGYDAPRKRKDGVIERWLDKGDKTFNVVVARNYNEIMKEPCWVLIHVGKFTRRKK